MGILSSFEPRRRLDLPETPPGLTSSGPSLSNSSRPSEDKTWRLTAPISPPMSSHDQPTSSSMSTAPSADEAQGPRESSQAPPRQQLPSLSSLLGQLGAARPPLHSPLSERPQQPFSATSPLDRPPHGGHQERSFSSASYFPASASSSASQPRTSFDPRFDDRGSFPSLARTPFPGPLSPHGREPDYHRPESRSDYRPGSRWSGPQEYSLGNREQQTFRPPPDRYSPHVPGTRHEQDSGAYRDQRLHHPSAGTLPPTPTSTAASEGIPAKDGLGPKIWTGSQFLPRFVRAAEVPGEGLCYFYDDGSHCKTVIDGEPVNAHWGVTKAGKPRKRLAIACITCREKKIKCDPDYPRCVQCEKFGRICKFKNAPRGGHNTSPSTPPAEPESSRRLSSFVRPPPGSPRAGSTSSASVSPRTTMRPASPDNLGGPSKRMRIGYDHFPPPLGPPRPSMSHAPELVKPGYPMPWQQHSQHQHQHQHHQHHHQPKPELPRLHEDVLARAWQTDPYVSDPQSVSTTVASFFVHMDCAALRFLPDRAFKAWLQNGAAAHNRKSPEDMMLVYSILALGVALSVSGSGSSVQSNEVAFEYAQVARYAMDRSKLSIQLVQARLVLALYYISGGRSGEAGDMLSGAISAASSLQLNVEFEKCPEASSADALPYGLNKAGFAECRRRTFWACFILERLSGLFPVRPSMINTEDIFLRLPCDNKAFEEQLEVPTPPFEPHFSAVQQQSGSVGVMGYLVQIVAVWGDIMASIHRVAHRSSTISAYSDFDFIKYHHLIISRLEDWRSSLPERLTYSAANLRAAAGDDRGCFIAMHLVYHMAIIKLHRHVHPRFLTPASRGQYSRAAASHARKLLDLWCGAARSSPPVGVVVAAPPPPFASVALLEAADVCAAEGAVADVPALLDALGMARAAMDALAPMWADAVAHRAALQERLDRLVRVQEQHQQQGATSSSSNISSPVAGVRVVFAGRDDEGKEEGGWRWQMAEPLEVRFPREMDCVYNSAAQLP